jgi:2-epi-5-epi-valiolone synthase
MQSPATYEMTCKKSHRYHVTMVERLLSPDNEALAQKLGGRRALFVTTPSVERLYGQHLQALIDRHRLRAEIVVLSCSEQHKTLRQVEWLCEEARQRGLDRKSVLLGVGGGVCTDIVSVAAAAIRRGVATVRVPTTLIGIIDAGIGLKGAVNFAGKKSFLGCFYPPEAVLIDRAFLRTLPQQLLRVGLSEIIKIALVRDAELFELVVAHGAELLASAFTTPGAPAARVLWLSIQRMLEELEQNPYEDRTYQRLVDFGHTFSPLLEAESGFTLHHGEAVAIDMALCATLAEERGLLSARDRARIIEALRAAGLPIYVSRLDVALASEALREAMRHRGGAVNLVVPVAIGRATFIERLDEVPSSALEAAIGRLARESAAASPLLPAAYASAPMP